VTTRGAGGWVCLLYHDIGEATSSRRGGGREWFAVPETAFARQLDLVRDAGYRGCSIAHALVGDGPRVAISFDDGMRSDYERAFPALVARGMTATFFVITDRVGTPGYVTWPELREMRQAGMSVQSHTRRHPFLSELDAAGVREELAGAKAALDDALGQDTDQLALPGGDAPAGRLGSLIAETGYRVLATSRWGRNRGGEGDLPRRIRRCTVAGVPDDARFRRMLRGDWSLGLRRRLREGVLARVRAILGPTRYAAWRRRVLDGALRPR
jgi:peptidoglycan/xylan/chitin deacetylase (PgdA/CDA1 family)